MPTCHMARPKKVKLEVHSLTVIWIELWTLKYVRKHVCLGLELG